MSRDRAATPLKPAAERGWCTEHGPLIAIMLALGAAVAWGTSDFLGGLKGRSVALPSVLLVSQGCALALLLTFTVVRSAGAPEAPALGFAALAARRPAVCDPEAEAV